MSHSVDRLKELLFESESRALSDVQQRLEAVFSRAGTEERFRVAVAGVLDRALRQAETDRHAELSEAVAPLIVRTIRTEIVNSRDELVDALYPITGRMVKAYVASAIADLAAQINRKVEGNPLMLRVRSIFSGKSVAELAMADANSLRVEQIYLIRRGTGELIGHWPQNDSDNRSQVMSGVLAAINEFASDAFGEDGASLRQIDMGDARVYLRTSPLYLLAARCTGIAPVSVERLLDDAFLSTIERCQTLTAPPGSSPPPAPYQNQLSRLSDQLTIGFDGLATRQSRSGISPAILLLGFVGLVLAGIGGWIALDRYFVHRAQDIALAAIKATPGTTGYPVDIDVGPFGRRVSLTGLIQDQTVKSGVLQQLRSGLPGTTIDDHLTPLPGVNGDIGPAIERAAITASLVRAAHQLENVTIDLSHLTATTDQPAQRQLLDRTTTLAAKAAKELRNAESDLQRSPDEQFKLGEELRQKAAEIAAIATGRAPSQPIPANAPAETAAESAGQLELAADQIATVAAALVQADAVRRNLPPAATIVRAPDITAFERLAVFVRTHAVFFADDLAYRNDDQAGKTLDELARLMRETAALLRIVGYTDAKGTADRNLELSANRARKVLDALASRGVPTGRLVAVGRHDANQIASAIGETSPNRRVEFELGFDGEGTE